MNRGYEILFSHIDEWQRSLLARNQFFGWPGIVLLSSLDYFAFRFHGLVAGIEWMWDARVRCQSEEKTIVNRS